MKTFKRIEILCTTFLALFLVASIALAQDEWATSGGDNIYNTNSGNVGIGTVNPVVKFHVDSGSVGTYGVRIQRNGSGPSLRVIQDGVGDVFSAYKGSEGNGLLVKNNGNVGIGTTNPQDKLDVNGRLFIRGNSNSFYSGGDNIIAIGADGTAGNYGYLWWDDTGKYFKIAQQNGGNQFVLASGGNVGIGTTSPGRRLGLAGNMGLSGSILMGGNAFLEGGGNIILVARTLGNEANDFAISTYSYTNSNWFDRLLINGDSGNVGIGTTGPLNKFHVEGSIAASYVARIVNNDETGNGLKIYAGSSSLEDSFKVLNSAGTANLFNIKGNGNVGIGTTDPQSRLAVNGTITAKEVKVTETGWADFVFEDDYELPSLSSVESYIKKNKHLPDIPSAQEVEQEGLAVSDILAKQMQKIEELTLYLIQLKKENEKLKLKNTEFEKRLAKLEADE